MWKRTPNHMSFEKPLMAEQSASFTIPRRFCHSFSKSCSWLWSVGCDTIAIHFSCIHSVFRTSFSMVFRIDKLRYDIQHIQLVVSKMGKIQCKNMALAIVGQFNLKHLILFHPSSRWKKKKNTKISNVFGLHSVEF